MAPCVTLVNVAKLFAFYELPYVDLKIIKSGKLFNGSNFYLNIYRIERTAKKPFDV